MRGSDKVTYMLQSELLHLFNAEQAHCRLGLGLED